MEKSLMKIIIYKIIILVALATIIISLIITKQINPKISLLLTAITFLMLALFIYFEYRVIMRKTK